MTQVFVKPDDKFSGTDIVQMLLPIGEWLVQGPETQACLDMILYAGDLDLITIRKHFGVMFPDGIDAYEVTDKGLEIIAQVLGDKAAIGAEELRTFYREHATADTWQAAAKKFGLIDETGRHTNEKPRMKHQL